MRVISWTVVVGSVSAILYGGVRPLIQDLNLPEVNATQAAGTVARPSISAADPCIELDSDQAARDQNKQHAQDKSCNEPRLANQ